MNTAELKRELVRPFRPDAYSLDGGLPDEKYLLSSGDGLWETYFPNADFVLAYEDFRPNRRLAITSSDGIGEDTTARGLS
jgi:hypothetical protein